MDRREFFKLLPLAPFAVKPAVESVSQELLTEEQVLKLGYYDEPAPTQGFEYFQFVPRTSNFSVSDKDGAMMIINHSGFYHRVGDDLFKKIN